MKTIPALKSVLLLCVALAMLSCGTQFKGSAADRTGTNGATNGNGKIPSGTAHSFRY